MAKQTFTTGQVLTAAQMTSLQQTAMGGGSATAKTASYVLVAADAGTTVAMNAAGATTITVNTSLFAAGDTVFIQNLGAGACTVTAGTATVATAGSLILPQNDAGILYFTATGASIFYDFIQAGAVSPLTTKGDVYTFSTSDARIGVGANNTVLTADSAEATGLKWATPAGGVSKSFTLLNSGGTALTGAQTITVSSISGQQALMLRITGASNATGSSRMYMRINGDTSGSNYSFSGVRHAAASNSSESGTDYGIPLGQMSDNAVSGVSAFATILGISSTSGNMQISSEGMGTQGGGTGQLGFSLQGIYVASAAITSISVFSETDNFDAGTLFVYGMAV